ncbi:MAG: aminopeptidase P family protein [Pseudomonadales bacterium]
MNTIRDRIEAVRKDMTSDKLDAFIVPRADEYLGEYVPEHNERLAYISGFTGSAGAVIILKDLAAVFVDGRYTIQVQQQVPSELFEYHHLIEDPPLKWLGRTLKASDRVGIDSRLHPYSFYQQAEATLAPLGITLVEMDTNPIDTHWSDRPTPEPQVAMLLGEEYTGEHSSLKRERIGAIIEAEGGDAALITQLDSIAWLLNIRGADVPRLPVLLGFAILRKNGDMTFFTDPRKIPNDLFQHVGEGVEIRDEAKAVDAIEELGKSGSKILVDKNTTNAYSVRRCIDYGCEIVSASDPVLIPKAQKNSIELNGMRNCHVRDGSAVSKYLSWLDSEVAASRLYHEGELSDRLESFRRELSGIHDLSFDTISASGANGALCHYNHTNGTPSMLELDSLYLVDSGGQYADGTTDITRTVAIGNATSEHKHMFTLVLKGHIALATAVFPRGTSGVQLDALARQFLWQEGFDYDHGTGHGVGTFLCVHEGPQRISKLPSPNAELRPGMVLSNEPGYYKEDCYGIRCENLMIVNQRSDGMLNFETITFAPFDRRLIETELLTQNELRWINQYHQDVFEKLSPLMSGDSLTWLEQSTLTI